MLKNPVLFHAFNIEWTVLYVMFATSALSLLVGGALLTYVLRREGRKRALEAQELETLGRTPDGNPVRMHWVGAQGSRVEAKADLETLRRAAERGDWALFWAWPCLLISWGSGFGLFFSALSILDPKEWQLYVFLGGGSGLLFAAFGVFMPWAALYTNIDKPSKTPEP
jgi:hypothetical protein